MYSVVAQNIVVIADAGVVGAALCLGEGHEDGEEWEEELHGEMLLVAW